MPKIMVKHLQKNSMSHEKNPPSNFPLNPGWLIGILMSWFIIIPIKLGRMSSPIYPKQPGFSHCSHVLPPKQHWKNPAIGDFLELFWSRTSRCENWQTSTVFHLGCNFKLPKTRPVSQGGIWGVLACCKILWVVASLSCKILLHPPPPKFKSSPLKYDGLKTILSFWHGQISRGRNLKLPEVYIVKMSGLQSHQFGFSL